MKQEVVDHFLQTIAATTTDDSLREEIKNCQEIQKDDPCYYESYDNLEILYDPITDAILFAMNYVPQVRHEVWFGQIGEDSEGGSGLWGTYYANSDGSHWFPKTTPKDAITIISGTLLDLTNLLTDNGEQA